MNTHSEHLNELFAALAKAQASIFAAAKDKVNPFYKSRYSDLSSVWDAIREPLSQNGLTILQPFGGTKEAMTLETWIGHSSGQWMKSTIPITPLKSDPQSLGSYITYLRRYTLSALVGVVSDEDDDANTATHHKTANKEKVKDWQSTLPKVDTNLRQEKVDTISQQVTEAMEKELMDILLQDLEYKAKVDEFLGSKNFTSFTQLAYADFEKIMKRAKERLNDTAKSEK
jgi:hypothetical protein